MPQTLRPSPATLPFPSPPRKILCKAEEEVVIDGVPVTVRIVFESAKAGEPTLPFAPGVACRLQVTSPAARVHSASGA